MNNQNSPDNYINNSIDNQANIMSSSTPKADTETPNEVTSNFARNWLPFLSPDGKPVPRALFRVQCAICTETQLNITQPADENDAEEAILLPCGHIFGSECLRQWMRITDTPTCPICRCKLWHRGCHHPVAKQRLKMGDGMNLRKTIIRGTIGKDQRVSKHCRRCKPPRTGRGRYWLGRWLAEYGGDFDPAVRPQANDAGPVNEEAEGEDSDNQSGFSTMEEGEDEDEEDEEEEEEDEDEDEEDEEDEEEEDDDEEDDDDDSRHIVLNNWGNVSLDGYFAHLDRWRDLDEHMRSDPAFAHLSEPEMRQAVNRAWDMQGRIIHGL